MQFDAQGIIDLLEQQKAAIESAIAALKGSGKPRRKGKRRSKATRLLMSKAQRRRWKVLRGKKSKS
jgi:hypothetical protein